MDFIQNLALLLKESHPDHPEIAQAFLHLLELKENPHFKKIQAALDSTIGKPDNKTDKIAEFWELLNDTALRQQIGPIDFNPKPKASPKPKKPPIVIKGPRGKVKLQAEEEFTEEEDRMMESMVLTHKIEEAGEVFDVNPVETCLGLGQYLLRSQTIIPPDESIELMQIAAAFGNSLACKILAD